MTLRKKILKALAEAPSTAPELGSIILPKEHPRRAMRRCSAYCCFLRTQGKTKVVGKVHRDGFTGTRNMANLWALA